MNSLPLRIPARYCGPPRSANGGYTCGLLAAAMQQPGARVRLKAPPPLEVDLQLTLEPQQACLRHGDQVIAEAVATDLELALPANPGLTAARAASSRYEGFRQHAFPGCFVCGPDRSAGDGLQVYAGPLDDSGLIASPWQPHAGLAGPDGLVDALFLWAALDCPGAFAWHPLTPGRALVLGELSARIEARPRVDESCVVLGWPLEADGRRRHAGTAIHGEDGRLLACARATWIDVPLAQFTA